MTQEQLDNLKIEDLEEVTEGFFPDGEDMIIASGNSRRLECVFAIVKNNGYGIVVKDDSYCSELFKAYKIPTPKMRDMTILEKIKYLKNKEDNLTEHEVLVATLKNQVGGNDWSLGYKTYIKFFSDDKLKFGIYDDTGEITEFKLPQVEV